MDYFKNLGRGGPEFLLIILHRFNKLLLLGGSKRPADGSDTGPDSKKPKGNFLYYNEHSFYWYKYNFSSKFCCLWN